jgi:poly(hydroxyalkanoate) depolymerase family esterase
MLINQDIIREATRLTRAGRLVEATALLQHMLHGEAEADATSRTDAIALPGDNPSIIDVKAIRVKETESSQSPRTTSAKPRKFSAPSNRTNNHPALRLRAATLQTPPSSRDIVPERARFITGSYSNPAGSRAYRLFIPSGYHGQPLPLIVMLHGCTQSPEDFAAGTRMNFIAEAQPCFVAYPAQRSEANQAKCWNWFRTTDQQRDTGEPSLIAGITRQIMREYSVDPKRIYVAGLSAGAAAAAIMGATYNDLYAAVGVHSGLACGAANDLPSALLAMRQGSGFNHQAALTKVPTVPTIVFHGDRDSTVHPSNGDQVIRQSINAASTETSVYRGQVAGGHAYTRTVHSDAAGRHVFEHWRIHGAGHAWSGGSSVGSYTDPRGPDATREMLRFFLEHSLS